LKALEAVPSISRLPAPHGASGADRLSPDARLSPTVTGPREALARGPRTGVDAARTAPSHRRDRPAHGLTEVPDACGPNPIPGAPSAERVGLALLGAQGRFPARGRTGPRV